MCAALLVEPSNVYRCICEVSLYSAFHSGKVNRTTNTSIIISVQNSISSGLHNNNYTASSTVIINDRTTYKAMRYIAVMTRANIITRAVKIITTKRIGVCQPG